MINKCMFRLKAQYNTCLEAKKHLVAESIRHFERAVELDPHDDLAHLYCALEYANCEHLSTGNWRNTAPLLQAATSKWPASAAKLLWI